MAQVPQSSSLPVVPMRNAVLFPGVTFPISAGRAGTLRAIEAAMSTPERLVFAVAQRSDSENVSPTDLYTIGTIATLGSIQRGIGGIRLVLEGKSRGIALRVAPKNGYLEATVQHAQEMLPLDSKDAAFAGLHREARERAAELGKKLGLPDETVEQILAEVDEPGRLADLVAGYLDIPVADKQALLETLSVEDRLRRVLVHVQRQIDVLSAQEDIQSKVKEEIGSRQREMYLREQMKAIQKELGEGEGARTTGLKELRAKLDALDLPEEARKEVDREWARLTRIGRESMESQVIRTYLENIAELPWNTRTDEKLEVGEAAGVLDKDHYGLKDVKDRILEFLAVRQLAHERESAAPAPDGAATAETKTETDKTDKPAAAKRSGKGRILLFAGPPGVGKTSIAKSIARAMGRKYVRISLGGARDEADIRGHRRTYIGAMPGPHHPGHEAGGHEEPGLPARRGGQARRLLPGRPGVGAARGARPGAERQLHGPLPRRAVRPVGGALHRDGQLHPEHPGPLLDRMEVVNFAGYTEEEKLQIAKSYLVPRQVEENGLEGRPAHAHRRRHPRSRHELHARVRRAAARARARQARPQGRAAHRRPRDREV